MASYGEGVTLTDSQRQLAADHVGLVSSIATRLCPRGVDVDDLIGDGMVGLCDAAIRYRPDAGAKFSTYAKYRVRGAIFDGIRRRRGRRGERWEMHADIETLDSLLPPTADHADLVVDRTAILGVAADDRDRRWLTLLLADWTQDRVAAMSGVDPSRVCQRLREFRRGRTG